MAISGAAFAPGLGRLTKRGISALSLFAGLRLGYWWNSAGAGIVQHGAVVHASPLLDEDAASCCSNASAPFRAAVRPTGT